jgi:hypothetical protein
MATIVETSTKTYTECIRDRSIVNSCDLQSLFDIFSLYIVESTLTCYLSFTGIQASLDVSSVSRRF